jgi:hypothetical protein
MPPLAAPSLQANMRGLLPTEHYIKMFPKVRIIIL